MKDGWLDLWCDVRSRVISVLEPPRLMYFLFVVVGLGGLGAWQAIPNTVLLYANLQTYAMGISAAAAVELILPNSTNRALRMLAISLGIATYFFSLLDQQNGFYSVLATLFALLLWILSSSSNPNIGNPSLVAATGGDTNLLAGNLAGFQTEVEV